MVVECVEDRMLRSVNMVGDYLGLGFNWVFVGFCFFFVFYYGLFCFFW